MPLISLAAELQTRGHNVTFFTPVQKGNEDAPAQTLREAGIPYAPLGISPLNKTELEVVLDQMRRGTNLFGIVSFCMDADVAAYVDMDRLLSERSIPAPDVLVACAVMQGTGRHIGLQHGIPTLLNYPMENYFWRPPWPFPELGSGLSDRMTFPQRLKNELVSLINRFVLEPYLLRVVLPEILKRRGVPVPARVWTPSIFAPDNTLSIINTAPGFDFPAPLPPSVIQPGPLVMTAAQTVPESLQTWVDWKPERSVVLVSLGTVSYIDGRIARVVIDGLRATGKDVLWVLREAHWKALAGLDVPSTFRLEKWIPQRAMLAHRAVGAMVTHCGTNGVQVGMAGNWRNESQS
jgi:UDP:flavonoid glycosyltransferase YjiC (YdhE family)